MVESQLQGISASAPGRWCASRFLHDATTELACLTGTASDDGDEIVNLARTIQFVLTMLQVLQLVQSFDDSKMLPGDRKRIVDFANMVLRKEPESWC
jgi:hypothetical protein